MMVKVVYVVEFKEDTCIYEMFLLSLYSLRMREPDREVDVILDAESYERIITKKDPILQTVKLVRVEVPPEYAGVERSRYLKTGLRDIVEGDFLYIDTDTVISDTLKEIDAIDADIAAVANENAIKLRVKKIIKQCELAGFPDMDKEPFFNGGVFLVRDTSVSRRFFRSWRDYWVKSVKNGVPYDQPALFISNRENGHPIRELPGEWNCQICADLGPHFLKAAKIIHYFASISEFPTNVIIPHIKEPGMMDDVALGIARNPKRDGFKIYHHSDFVRIKGFYSEVLFRVSSFPILYDVVRRCSLLLVDIASWCKRMIG